MIDIYNIMRKWYIKEDFDDLLKMRFTTQKKLAMKLGLSENTITRIKKPEKEFHPDTVRMIADYFKMKYARDDTGIYFYEEEIKEPELSEEEYNNLDDDQKEFLKYYDGMSDKFKKVMTEMMKSITEITKES